MEKLRKKLEDSIDKLEKVDPESTQLIILKLRYEKLLQNYCRVKAISKP